MKGGGNARCQTCDWRPSKAMQRNACNAVQETVDALKQSTSQRRQAMKSFPLSPPSPSLPVPPPPADSSQVFVQRRLARCGPAGAASRQGPLFAGKVGLATGGGAGGAAGQPSCVGQRGLCTLWTCWGGTQTRATLGRQGLATGGCTGPGGAGGGGSSLGCIRAAEGPLAVVLPPCVLSPSARAHHACMPLNRAAP